MYYSSIGILALIILLIVNRNAKISGLHYIWPIIGIVFGLTLCEALADICDTYQWNYRILYFKTTMVYWLYPLVALLEVLLVAPIKRKFLIAIPYLINSVLAAINLFDIRIIYIFTYIFVIPPFPNSGFSHNQTF